jgi:hypothetical protein
MATTPNYSWQTPDDTDLVKDGAAAIRELGDDIDSTTKSIDDRVDALEVITTQGDLIVGDASGDPSRLGVGALGQVLASNGTTATWSTPSGSAPPVIPRIGSGIYLGTLRGLVTATDPTNNTTYYAPIYLPTCTLDRIGFRAAGYSATGNVRLGIYQNSATTNLPSTLLLDAGTVSVTANSTYEITINQAITAGWHWLAINKNGGTFDLYRNNDSIHYPLFTNNATNSLSAAASLSHTVGGYAESGITGAFANAGTISVNVLPFISAVRMA